MHPATRRPGGRSGPDPTGDHGRAVRGMPPNTFGEIDPAGRPLIITGYTVMSDLLIVHSSDPARVHSGRSHTGRPRAHGFSPECRRVPPKAPAPGRQHDSRKRRTATCARALRYDNLRLVHSASTRVDHEVRDGQCARTESAAGACGRPSRFGVGRRDARDGHSSDAVSVSVPTRSPKAGGTFTYKNLIVLFKGNSQRSFH